MVGPGIGNPDRVPHGGTGWPGDWRIPSVRPRTQTHCRLTLQNSGCDAFHRRSEPFHRLVRGHTLRADVPDPENEK